MSESKQADLNYDGWTVLLPGLTEDAARRVLDFAESTGQSSGGEALDPTHTLPLYLDRTTAEWLRAALSAGDSEVLGRDGLTRETVTPTEARGRIPAVLEYIDEFLQDSDS